MLWEHLWTVLQAAIVGFHQGEIRKERALAGRSNHRSSISSFIHILHIQMPHSPPSNMECRFCLPTLELTNQWGLAIVIPTAGTSQECLWLQDLHRFRPQHRLPRNGLRTRKDCSRRTKVRLNFDTDSCHFWSFWLENLWVVVVGLTPNSWFCFVCFAFHWQRSDKPSSPTHFTIITSRNLLPVCLSKLPVSLFVWKLGLAEWNLKRPCRERLYVQRNRRSRWQSDWSGTKEPYTKGNGGFGSWQWLDHWYQLILSDKGDK